MLNFLGIGGTWSLNEEKSPDGEIIASGILVGYFIYTSVQLIAYFFREDKQHRELSDTIMNVVGVILWLGVGVTALHYWIGYWPDYDALVITSERTVKILANFVKTNQLNFISLLIRWVLFWEYFVSLPQFYT